MPRRCERCAFREKCYLWYEEQQMLERHLLRGEDPDDPEVVMADVRESFRKTTEMLLKMAEKMGIDLSECDDAPVPRLDAYQEHPLFQRAMAWSDRMDAFAKRVGEEAPGAVRAMIGAYERGEIKDALLALGRLQGVKDDIELLMRYRFLIPAKVARAVGREDWEEEDEVIAESSRSDALGTARLVDECLKKTAASLWRLGEFDPRWLEQAMLCAGEAEGVRAEIRTAFPGLEAFRRPGRTKPDQVFGFFFGSLGGRSAAQASERATHSRARFGSERHDSGRVTYSAIGRPGIGAKGAAPGSSSSSSRSASGRRTKTVLPNTPVNMFPFTKPARLPNIGRVVTRGSSGSRSWR
jgi:hypothetical protein